MGSTRSQINWISHLEDGSKIEVRANKFPKRWTLKYRLKGDLDWTYDWEAPLSEWETLLDALERRYQRRHASIEDLKEVRAVISRLKNP